MCGLKLGGSCSVVWCRYGDRLVLNCCGGVECNC